MLVLKKINDPGRISSIDFFRSLAILSVVIFHFNSCLPLGYIGVDMFFVISGVLIGAILTREFKQGKKINFVKFFIQRALKILPSYYAFLTIGTLIALLLYHTTHPDQIIHDRDCLRYLFFYENYTGVPHHWSFSHLWSLCVEEHFYILLPVLFIIIQIMPGNQLRALFISVIAIIILGIAFKFISFYCTNGQDTYSATHNRIDALAWGVLLNLIINYYPGLIKSFLYRHTAKYLGLVIFSISMIYSHNYLFDKLLLHSLIPISFVLVLSATYYVDFTMLKPLRIIAYYSYNWYLWHIVFAIFITDHFGNTITGLIIYLLLTFAIAVIATILIEEFFLKKRELIFYDEKERM